MIGKMIGTYKIVEKLGEGGMGTVYKGVDTMLEREIAIKMLRPEIACQQDVVERFRAEAVTLAKLNHPSIATLFNFICEGDQLMMVMEFVPGRTLEHVIQKSGALPFDYVINVMSKVLDGIEHAHRLGILHRDLKPANIMLTDSGSVKVMDFGIARILGAARMTRSGRIVGTLEYIAPERIKGQEADVRSDLYSMGVVLYEMLTGSVPFNSDSEYELMRAQLEQDPPPIESFGREVPPEIKTAVVRALAKNPNDRFASAAEFRAVLLDAPLPAGESVSPSIKPTRLATTVGKQSFAGQKLSGRGVFRPGWAAKLFGSLFKWKFDVAVVAFIVAVALGSMIWFSRRRAVEVQAEPPASIASQEQMSSNPSSGPVGTSFQSVNGDKKKPDIEDLVRSAKSLPGAIVDQPMPSSRKSTNTNSVLAPPASTTDITSIEIPAGSPLSLAEIVTLLHAGTPSDRVVQFVQRRGVDFSMSPQIADQILGAGGDRNVIAAATQHSVVVAKAAPLPSPVPIPVSPTVSAVSAPPASLPSAVPNKEISRSTTIASLAQVHIIYVEPMENDLHVHIKAELLRQLGGRFQLATSKELADAVMSATGENRTGTTSAITGKVLGVTNQSIVKVRMMDNTKSNLLWVDEVGSREIMMGLIKKGGPRKMAERLISDLKKAL